MGRAGDIFKNSHANFDTATEPDEEQNQGPQLPRAADIKAKFQREKNALVTNKKNDQNRWLEGVFAQVKPHIVKGMQELKFDEALFKVGKIRFIVDRYWGQFKTGMQFHGENCPINDVTREYEDENYPFELLRDKILAFLRGKGYDCDCSHQFLGIYGCPSNVDRMWFTIGLI